MKVLPLSFILLGRRFCDFALAGAGEVEAVGEGVDSLKVHVPGIMIKSWHVPSCVQLLFKGRRCCHPLRAAPLRQVPSLSPSQAGIKIF